MRVAARKSPASVPDRLRVTDTWRSSPKKGEIHVTVGTTDK
jgi:hypothetical protein